MHDNQTLGWGLLGIHKLLPVLATIHHPITVDRRLEIAHARTRMERIGKRRWYAFTRMQTQVAKRMDRVMTVSENSKVDIAADHKVDLEKIHVVPVGVDPDLFRPADLVELRGDPSRIASDTGWAPTHVLDGTLVDLLEDWRKRLTTAD